MGKELLLGAEAIAQGAIDAGISGVYAYPGTPSTEIATFVQNSKEARAAGIRAAWSTNEKTACEAALGMSFAGKRSIVCMKHVGMNVAADAFINSAVTGVNGGLVVLSADDPSMHSSQNEQDSRFYGKFAMIPVLEPSNQQEAYDSVALGLDLSEKVKLPVLIRLTTRLSHSRSGIVRTKSRNQNGMSFPENPRQFVLLPAIARRQYHALVEAQPTLESLSENSPFNKLTINKKGAPGVIAFGIGYNYLMENIQNQFSEYNVLKIGQYPMPRKMVESIIRESSKILVLEEGYPIYEELLRGYLDNGAKINGRLDKTVNREGELSPDTVAKALGLPCKEQELVNDVVKMRPPSFCQGCSHNDMYNTLNIALADIPDHKVFADIGCYTLGAQPPYNAINSCVDMGASITMAKGAADAGLRPAVAVIGDSTFTHSGMTGLLDAVNDKSPITLIISDNDTTAMTGGQDSAGTGKLGKICEGIGVDPAHIRLIIPLPKNQDENVAIMKEEFAYNGVSVIIANRECIQTLSRKKKTQKA